MDFPIVVQLASNEKTINAQETDSESGLLYINIKLIAAVKGSINLTSLDCLSVPVSLFFTQLLDLSLVNLHKPI